MGLPGPFDHLPTERRRAHLGKAIAAVVGVGALMVPSTRRMRATGGPDIVPFELAGSRPRVDEILERWGAEGRAAARQNLLLDQVWLLTYSTSMALSAAEAGRAFGARGWHWTASVSGVMGWAPYVAAALDAVENTSLLALVDGSPSTRLPVVAARAARVKFALVALSLPYGLAGLAVGRRGSVKGGR